LGRGQIGGAQGTDYESVAMSFALQMIVAALAAAVVLSGGRGDTGAQPVETAPLQLEAKIPLGSVRGRIDHMAVDLKRQRLFVAELGNDSVGIVDLANRKLIRTITGLKEPQGVGYEPSTDVLYVANAGDGSVRLFEGADYAAREQIELGSDADNIRVDAVTNRVFIGYGGGALAVIDPSTRKKIGDIRVKAHPEAFQIDPDTSQVFVNVPDAHAIAVIDRVAQKQIEKWPLADRGGNFPMALDHVRRQVLVIFRAPAEFGIFAMTGGKLVATTETCGDADDVFVDTKRGRVYVSCGVGFIDVFETKGATHLRTARIPTVSGARTSLFVPELDRLLVGALRRTGSHLGVPCNTLRLVAASHAYAWSTPFSRSWPRENSFLNSGANCRLKS
jgi:YVTN family beta-propeller protein